MERKFLGFSEESILATISLQREGIELIEYREEEVFNFQEESSYTVYTCVIKKDDKFYEVEVDDYEFREYEENYDGWAYGVEVFPKEITKTIYVRELDKQE